MIRYMGITHDSVVDGEGLRSVLFTCGCSHRCEGCHNEESWHYKNGTDISVEDAYKELVNNPLTNITYSGGDPFEQPQEIYKLSKMIADTTDKTIWCYSGYLFEDIIKDSEKLALLKYIDVLVDGRFELDKKDLSLLFKGSSNQRVISVKESLKQNKVILYFN